MRFGEYARNRERMEIVSLLEGNGIRLGMAQIEVLLEAGWLSGAAGKVGRAALLASLPLSMSANWADHQPKPYHFSGSRFMANQQHMDDEAADKAYVDAGGPDFEETDGKDFLAFKKTPKHARILKTAGLPSDYIPSKIRNFLYGMEISATSELGEESVDIKGEIQRRFGRESFVEIIQSKDAVTGGAVLLVSANGVVMAMNAQDAARRAEVVMREMAREKGFEVRDFKDLNDRNVVVNPAPRSTVDFATESAESPHRFSVQFKLIPRRRR